MQNVCEYRAFIPPNSEKKVTKGPCLETKAFEVAIITQAYELAPMLIRNAERPLYQPVQGRQGWLQSMGKAARKRSK